MHFKDWDNILEKLLKHPDFVSQMDQTGYYLSPKNISFGKYCSDQWQITPTRNTAAFLSINFWHEQPKVLRENDKYLIRTGEGTFAIFNGKEFPRPYLTLNEGKTLSNSTLLNAKTPEGFGELYDAFQLATNEDSTLEYLQFSGVYDEIIKLVTGKRQSYHGGFRGGAYGSFDLFLKRNTERIEKIERYVGQTEIDYTLWTPDSIFLFEAKRGRRGEDLDIGWHKFAYPAASMTKYAEKFKVYPTYLLRRPSYILLLVFPSLAFHNNGVILNDLNQLTPMNAFVIPAQATLDSATK